MGGEAYMGAAALVALAVFASVAFGWRAWLQYRRTGDTGLRGSGLWLLPGTVAIVLGPILYIVGAISPIAALDHRVAHIAGIVCFILGFGLTVRAQLDMGASWRVGVDTTETTALVTGGVFRFVRNPIFSGMALAFIGVALMVPNAVAIAGMVLIGVGLQIQVRLVEEPYLLTVHGDRYRRYADTAGRFVPGLGRGT